MARRRRKGRGRRKGAIPILPVLGVAFPALAAWQKVGATQFLPQELMFEYTGITKEGQWSSAKATKTLALVIGTGIAHKVANKVGVNKYIRKATMGWLVL